jgi:hypothetical protein
LLARLPEPKPSAEQYQMLSLFGQFAGRDEVFAALLAYLQSPEKLERMAAIEALTRYRLDDAQAALAACLAAERDPEVQQVFQEAGQVSRP